MSEGEGEGEGEGEEKSWRSITTCIKYNLVSGPGKPYFTVWTHYGKSISNAAFQGGIFKFGDG